MPFRTLVAKEMANLFGVLSHPMRIRIVEELRDQECDVKSLQAALGISHSGVSQHLMQLRAHRLVTERREGRQVYYSLRFPNLASWLAGATEFLTESQEEAARLRSAIKKTRTVWSVSQVS